eukprot:s3370_g1.t1
MADDDSKGDVKRPVEEGWETARPKKKRKAAQILAVDVNASYSPGLADVQSLLLRIFTEKYGENPRWLCVRGMNLVKCCRVVLLPCLESTVVLNRPASAPFLTSLLRSKNRVAMKTSSEVEHFPKDQGAADAGSRMLLSLLAARAKPTVAKKAKAKAPAKVQPGASEAKVPIREYLVSEEARNRSGYPDKSCCGRPGWVVLRERSDQGEGQLPAPVEGADEQASLDPDAKHLVALDCEMVMTSSGLSLARVSLVGDENQLLYDSFVQPDEPITDYLTQFSGITKETLDGVKVKLCDVQKRLQELLSQHSILVGHSLESDLKALQLFHERVIDTVLLYPHPRGWPCRQSLAGLCSAVLKRKLQRERGHDSIQDAKVALELALLKFARGPSFGATGGESVPLGRLLKETGVQLLISEADGADSSRASSWYEESCRRALLSELGADLKPAEDEEAESLSRRSVHIVVLRSFERFCETAHALSGGSLEDGLPDCLARIDRQAAKAAEGLTENDLLIMLNGCGNFQLLRKLMDAKCETATAPEKRKVARARDRFKDTWGVFQCGGAALEQLLKAPACVEAPPIPRELVSYDV